MVEEESTSVRLLNRQSSTVRVQIVPSTPKTLSNLPERPLVDLAFNNLSYTIKEGRRNSKYFFIFFILFYLLKT